MRRGELAGEQVRRRSDGPPRLEIFADLIGEHPCDSLAGSYGDEAGFYLVDQYAIALGARTGWIPRTH